MAFKHEPTRRYESVTCPGVSFYLHKLTEGRRINLRSRVSVYNRRVREIVKEQQDLEKVPEADRDISRWMVLQDEFDELVVEKVNPEWIKWGVKKVEGLEVEGNPLDVEQWEHWPSGLFEEILVKVKEETELNGVERKNFELPTISGELAGKVLKFSTAELASEKAGGKGEIAASTSPAE